MAKTRVYKYLSLTALAAGLALVGMLTVTLLNQGLTQQQFEIVTDVEVYARDLKAAEGPLRVILTLDNLFLVFYTAAFLFVTMAVKTDENRLIAYAGLGAILITTYLDLLENHHIMTMLTSITQGLPISLVEIQERMTWSQLKFHSSYLSFFLFAFVLPHDTLLEKGLRWSLWFVFLPVGVMVYTYPDFMGGIFGLLRYILMLSGLLILAWNYFVRTRQQS
ncbi:MAG: hypothetical protein H8E47_09475 [Anaerolineales bacterium]|nr:hypothetical protein [Anaerolineales bacterium]